LKAEHPDKKIAQYIMSQTVAVPHRYLKERERHPDYAAEIICHGLLSGIILFPSESKEYAFRANRKTMVLFVDNVLGLTIKEVG